MDFSRFRCPKDKHFLFAQCIKDGIIEVKCRYCKTTYQLKFKNGKLVSLKEIYVPLKQEDLTK